MRKSILSEKNIVVVLFVMVFITFAFAEKDTRKIEQMFRVPAPSTTVFSGQSENTEAGMKTTEVKQVIPAVQLR